MFRVNHALTFDKINVIRSIRFIEAEGARPPAGLAGQVRPRRRSRGG
jgi:hypothetical protein